MDSGLRFRENGAQNAHCRQKIQFFRVTMATGRSIRVRLKSSSFEPNLDHPTKFQLDRIIRLGSRAVRNIQTDTHTDGQTEFARLMLILGPMAGSRNITKIRFALRCLFRAFWRRRAQERAQSSERSAAQP